MMILPIPYANLRPGIVVGLRPVHYAPSPVSSACEGSQSSQQRRRRKKRSQHNRERMINESNSNGGSAREYNTNTDMSSGGRLAWLQWWWLWCSCGVVGG